jgi:hypothetical protein
MKYISTIEISKEIKGVLSPVSKYITDINCDKFLTTSELKSQLRSKVGATASSESLTVNKKETEENETIVSNLILYKITIV